MYPLTDLGGHGDLVHMAPANGFPPETYVPPLASVLSGHRVVSLPPRAMWPDAGDPPSGPGSWHELADDLLAGMEQHRLGPVVGIGHSFGAVATLLAAIREPSRFLGIALLDPTIFPPPMMEEFLARKARGVLATRPLADGARKRKDRFDSEAEAFAYWRDKPLFADWSDDAVRRYARAMLRPMAGGGYELTWRRDWEAYYYESFHAETWRDLEGLDQRIPMLVVGGETTDTFLAGARTVMGERLPHATHKVVAGYGHLFPQAAPDQTSTLLGEWIATL